MVKFEFLFVIICGVENVIGVVCGIDVIVFGF